MMKFLALILSLVLGAVDGVSDDSAKVELNEELITRYFEQLDKNSDDYLDVDEIPNWVRKMVNTHILENVPAAKVEFRSVDTNRDKIVTWEEYRIRMLDPRGEDNTDHPVYSEKEQKHKFRTADENGDAVLNQIEYVAFKNPMTTGYVLKRIAQELLEDFDVDKDGVVSLNEFVHHEASRVDDKDDVEINKLRRMEFKGALDTNDDQFLDLKELKSYLDPKGNNFVMNEARMMLHEADTNSDKKLSLDEIKENYLHFQHHKNNPVIRAIHDEF